MTSNDSWPKLQVQTGINNSQDPVVVLITTEGTGGLRVLLNGAPVFEGHPG